MLAERSKVKAAERQFQLWNVDSSVAVHVKSIHQRLHFPRGKVGDVGVLERFLELIGVHFSRLVEVNGVEEAEDRLTGV